MKCDFIHIFVELFIKIPSVTEIPLLAFLFPYKPFRLT